jgi:hypothetical protein
MESGGLEVGSWDSPLRRQVKKLGIGAVDQEIFSVINNTEVHQTHLTMSRT